MRMTRIHRLLALALCASIFLRASTTARKNSVQGNANANDMMSERGE